MSRLLITTFQNPSRNINEALLFKKGAMASKLLSVDRTNELWPLHPELLYTPEDRGIRPIGTSQADRVLTYYHLSQTLGAGWSRLTRLKSRRFHALLEQLYAEPVDCYVIGAHHHRHTRYRVMCWGTEFEPTKGDYRPYTGLGVDRATGELEWFGYPDKAEVPRDIPVPGATASLRRASLMVILGCNGVPHTYNGDFTRDMAAAWRRITRPALLLGWFGVHSLPKDANKRHAAERFWTKLTALKAKHGVPDGGLATLVTGHANDVMQAWGEACYEAFHGQAQIDLWRYRYSTGVVIGAGAVRQDGAVFHANPLYPRPGEPALLKVNGLVVP